VWAGVVLMGIGLGFVFYASHTRLWAVPAKSASDAWTLWVGGTANRNREAFNEKFADIAKHIGQELKQPHEEFVSHETAASVG
jgi:cytochrome c biogenesis protein